MPIVQDILKFKGASVWSISPAQSMHEALAMMSDHSVGALVVLDGETLVGVVSERDFARKVVTSQRLPTELSVREVMTTEPLLKVERETTIAECMRLMTAERVRHLPVMEQNRVVGIVSIGDVVSALLREKEHLIVQLEAYITGLR